MATQRHETFTPLKPPVLLFYHRHNCFVQFKQFDVEANLLLSGLLEGVFLSSAAICGHVQCRHEEEEEEEPNKR